MSLTYHSKRLFVVNTNLKIVKPLLILSPGWSTQTYLHPSISIKFSGVEESRKVLDRHMIKSCLYIELYAFNCVSFEKLCAVKLLRFQWHTEKELFFVFLGPEFSSKWHPYDSMTL